MANSRVRNVNQSPKATSIKQTSSSFDSIVGSDRSGESLTETELSKLVEEAAYVAKLHKQIGEKLDIAKKKIKQNAAANGWKNKVCGNAKVQIQSSSKTNTGPISDFVRILKREGKLSLLDSCVKVQVGQAKTLLGEDTLDGFLTVQKDEYGSVRLSYK